MSKTSDDFIKLWLMSTGTFSAENTFSVVRAVLDFLFPRLGPHQAATIHVIIRKAAHVFEYFILGLLLLRAFRAGSRGTWKWRWSFFAIICLILWSLGDEFHQSFVPTRTASMTDVAIDAAGGVLAQFVGAFWDQKHPLPPVTQYLIFQLHMHRFNEESATPPLGFQVFAPLALFKTKGSYLFICCTGLKQPAIMVIKCAGKRKLAEIVRQVRNSRNKLW
jgi:VanZ family protein